MNLGKSVIRYQFTSKYIEIYHFIYNNINNSLLGKIHDRLNDDNHNLNIRKI